MRHVYIRFIYPFDSGARHMRGQTAMQTGYDRDDVNARLRPIVQ